MSLVSDFRYDLQSLKHIMMEDAMRAFKACRSQFQASERTHNETLYETIGFIVEFVRYIEENPGELEAFLADPYWFGKPQAPKEKNLARLATMMMIGAKASRGARYQQALSYSKVVDYYLGGASNCDEIASDLQRQAIWRILDEVKQNDDDEKETGLGQPKAQARGVRPIGARRSSELTDDDDLLAGEDPDGQADEPADDDGPASIENAEAQSNPAKGASAGRRQAPVRTKLRRYPFKQSKELAIDVGVHRDRFFHMDVDDELMVTIRRIHDHDGWYQFEISGVGLIA